MIVEFFGLNKEKSELEEFDIYKTYTIKEGSVKQR